MLRHAAAAACAAAIALCASVAAGADKVTSRRTGWPRPNTAASIRRSPTAPTRNTGSTSESRRRPAKQRTRAARYGQDRLQHRRQHDPGALRGQAEHPDPSRRGDHPEGSAFSMSHPGRASTHSRTLCRRRRPSSPRRESRVVLLPVVAARLVWFPGRNRKVKPYTFNPAPFIADKNSNLSRATSPRSPSRSRNRPVSSRTSSCWPINGYDFYSTTIEARRDMSYRVIPISSSASSTLRAIGWRHYLDGDKRGGQRGDQEGQSRHPRRPDRLFDRQDEGIRDRPVRRRADARHRRDDRRAHEELLRQDGRGEVSSKLGTSIIAGPTICGLSIGSRWASIREKGGVGRRGPRK